ncbi:MAG TPA: hypothetical protein VGP73_08550 [Thermoanaerobaculia bacterium]
MKIFRIVGLIAILLSLYGGSVRTARASGISCSLYCSGVRYFATCYDTLSNCCSYLSSMCPDPSEYQGGGCSDGVNYC